MVEEKVNPRGSFRSTVGQLYPATKGAVDVRNKMKCLLHEIHTPPYQAGFKADEFN